MCCSYATKNQPLLRVVSAHMGSGVGSSGLLDMENDYLDFSKGMPPLAKVVQRKKELYSDWEKNNGNIPKKPTKYGPQNKPSQNTTPK